MAVTREEVRVHGTELADRIKQIIHEGNVRRIIVKNSHGHTVMEIPVTLGVVAFIAAPVATAAAALAALAAEWSIQVEREEPQAGPAALDGIEVLRGAEEVPTAAAAAGAGEVASAEEVPGAEAVRPEALPSAEDGQQAPPAG
ncbi:DUF4342 domain-containing protein [Planotetraspora sp. A-T 1434]|uniref:DUF4342 domain-containing protein n=1 Tax=Planotetraspora sp. A-T 1434 TaxID=2979219 RepID=UPI0021BE06A1|nr:DUF4342 domain-containing protein [Planotetraspora sp. A-T 1434]MCT9932178.1 DUF4342 domain-containing protein [Planotetraspora sp. A-T 1434]